MPLYDYLCPNCGEVKDVFAGINDKTLMHDKCKCIMKRQLHCQYGINMGPVPPGGYFDETLDQFISTKRQRERVMEEQGVSEKGATPKTNRQAWV